MCQTDISITTESTFSDCLYCLCCSGVFFRHSWLVYLYWAPLFHFNSLPPLLNYLPPWSPLFPMLYHCQARHVVTGTVDGEMIKTKRTKPNPLPVLPTESVPDNIWGDGGSGLKLARWTALLSHNSYYILFVILLFFIFYNNIAWDIRNYNGM